MQVAVIGPGGMGANHLSQLIRRSDIHITAVCDVEQERLHKAAEAVRTYTGTAPVAVQDVRKILDHRSIDGVFIATPDHWHGPAATVVDSRARSRGQPQ